MPNGNKKISNLFLLSNMTLITVSDDGKLGVWKRNDEDYLNKLPSKNNKEKIYTNIKTIPSLWSCYECLEVNENYFITLLRDCTLKFFESEEINEIKSFKIKYGDYLREKFNHMVKINNDYIIIGVKNIYVILSIKYMEIIQYFVLSNMKNIISLFKYEGFDNMILIIGKEAEDENIFYQYKFDEEDKILKEISHFENSIEKYGDYRFNFINNNMIISYYYYYSSNTNKKFELFA